ncbi:hypothetical protein BJ878DRAFT_72193 [Calycina marina]|uniref:EGF-like domain-containing protein n=1 Tax=Calycina marina TaxID=1763456 RepID=A0A9P8CES3_9HELO|nr:hypothetical protein BJ878DRAFT_72193 [Calycina marina]
MGSQPWAPPVKPAGMGSVSAARKRAEGGLRNGQQQKPQQQAVGPSQEFGLPTNPSASQIPGAQNLNDSLLDDEGPPPGIGVAVTRTTQAPQWPLGGGTPENTPYEPPPGRKNAPQRPPRPSYVPSMLDATRSQEHTPSFRVEAPRHAPDVGDIITSFREDESDEYDMRSPNSLASRPSTMSSVGTIPDFPMPLPPATSRRSANLGPPPTSRRGASSYYSNASFVSPIPEEIPRSNQSHGSYASSAAIPITWDSGSVGESPGLSPGYEYDESYYDDKDFLPVPFKNEMNDEGRESRESNFDDNDGRGLIRSASFGRRAKPSMIMTRGIDRSDGAKQEPMPQKSVETSGKEEGAEQPAWPIHSSMGAMKKSPLAGGTGLIDKSRSSSETSLPTLKTTQAEDLLPARTYNASGANDILGAYAAASALQSETIPPSRIRSPGFSRLSAIRRPPRLDIDAVRDAEARGSLTSLPDLIRRATKLAAMMDRGRRPASRLALDDFPTEKELEIMVGSDERRNANRQSGLSGMLAAFPPPGLVGTPTRDAHSPMQQVSSWPAMPSETLDQLKPEKKKKKGRRCCGLSLWLFVLMIILLLLIVAVAVLVPLFLLVWNKNSATTLSAQQQCAEDTATKCQNGGQSFVSSGTCACICINGFSGSMCTVVSDSACTTTTLSTSLSNVTLGDSIPRLLSAAQTNFSIPLDSSTILASFSTSNLSCLSENALVTFNGESTNANAVRAVTATWQNPTATANVKRDDSSSYSGILVDTQTSPTPSATHISYTTASPTTSILPSSITNAAAATSTGIFDVTDTVLDFARVAVLFMLQEETLEKASTAQTSFQTFFNSQTATNLAAANVSIGNGNTVNLINFQLSTGSTTVGALNISVY